MRILNGLYKVFELIFFSVLFFGLVAPIGICYRLMRRDVLNLRLHTAQKSYWIERYQAQTNPQDFCTQFIGK